MRIIRSDENQLVIREFPWIFPLVFLPMGAFMLVLGLIAVARAVQKPDFPWFGTGSGELWGALASGLLGVACGLAFAVRSEFTFDLVARQLTWTRRGPFSKTGGVVPFEQIRYAFTERNHIQRRRHLLRHAPDRRRRPLAQPVLQLRAVPVRPDPRRDQPGARSWLRRRRADGIPHPRARPRRTDPPCDRVRAERYGYDLTQAKAYVEGLKS